jgi:hypothetical protein
MDHGAGYYFLLACIGMVCNRMIFGVARVALRGPHGAERSWRDTSRTETTARTISSQFPFDP